MNLIDVTLIQAEAWELQIKESHLIFTLYPLQLSLCSHRIWPPCDFTYILTCSGNLPPLQDGTNTEDAVLSLTI